MSEAMECMQIQMSKALKTRAGRFYYAGSTDASPKDPSSMETSNMNECKQQLELAPLEI